MENLVRKTSLKEQKLAKMIISGLKKSSSMSIQIDGKPVKMTKGLVELLTQIFSMMADGKSIAVLASEMEVSTQEAAELLHFSRPYVVKLLEEGKIPFKKVGKHRRMLLKDVLFYRAQFKKRQKKALAFLGQQAQDLKLGYQ